MVTEFMKHLRKGLNDWDSIRLPTEERMIDYPDNVMFIYQVPNHGDRGPVVELKNKNDVLVRLDRLRKKIKMLEYIEKVSREYKDLKVKILAKRSEVEARVLKMGLDNLNEPTRVLVLKAESGCVDKYQKKVKYTQKLKGLKFKESAALIKAMESIFSEEHYPYYCDIFGKILLINREKKLIPIEFANIYIDITRAQIVYEDIKVDSFNELFDKLLEKREIHQLQNSFLNTRNYENAALWTLARLIKQELLEVERKFNARPLFDFEKEVWKLIWDDKFVKNILDKKCRFELITKKSIKVIEGVNNSPYLVGAPIQTISTKEIEEDGRLLYLKKKGLKRYLRVVYEDGRVVLE